MIFDFFVRNMFLRLMIPFLFLMTTVDAGPGADFMKGLGDRAIKTLVNADKSEAQIKKDFENLYADSFAEDELLKFFIGESQYMHMSDAQRARFKKLVRQDLSMSYAKRFKEYRGLQFEVDQNETTTQDPVFGSVIQVESKIIHPSKGTIPVIWILTQTPRIVDIKVEGLSMIQTKRKDYQASLNAHKGDIDAFLSALETNVKARSS